MHPSATKRHVNQQAASCPRSAKAGHPGGLAVTGLGKECTLLPREGQSPSCWSFIFTDGLVQSSRIRWGRPAERQKAKTKASDPPPEENRPRGQPPDHQARRRSRKESHPFPSGAKRKGESYWPARRKNAVDEDSQESPTAKTCSSY